MLKNPDGLKGFALPLAIMALLILSILGAALIKGSHTSLLSSSEEREKKALQNELMQSYSEISAKLAKRINDDAWPALKGSTKILYLESVSEPAPSGFDAVNTITFANLGYSQKENEVVRLTCLSEGAPARYRPCSGRETDFPKVFHLSIRRRLEGKNLTGVMNAVIEVGPASLANYSYLVSGETANVLSFDANEYNGRVGVFFNPTNGNRRIFFLNAAPNPLKFNDLVTFNIPQDQIKYGHDHALRIANGPISFEKGVIVNPQAAAPMSQLASNFRALANHASTRRYVGSETPVQGKFVFGLTGVGNECKIKVIQRVSTPCTPGGASVPGESGRYEPSKKSYEYFKEPAPSPTPVLRRLMNFLIPEVLGQLILTGEGEIGGSLGSPSTVFSPTSVIRSTCSGNGYTERIVYEGPVEDGKVYYVRGSQPTTVYSDRGNGEYAAICGRATFISDADIQLMQSSKRYSASGGTPSDTESHSALVSLRGDAGIIGPFSKMRPQFGDNNRTLATWQDMLGEMSEEFRNEFALVSLYEGKKSLYVNDAGLGMANQYGGKLVQTGAVISPSLGPTRLIYQTGSYSEIRGFKRVEQNFIRGAISNPPPGFDMGLSTELALVTTNVTFSFDDYEKALADFSQ